MLTHTTRYRIKVKSRDGEAFSFTPQYKCKFIPFWFSWKRFNEGGGVDPLSYGTQEEATKHIRRHIKSAVETEVFFFMMVRRVFAKY